MPSGHILVADDDAGIRTVLNQALTRAGYEVRATGTVAGLWRWVAAGEGDLVITDVVMPDDNAFDLLPRIKRMRPDLPIIVMSAQNTFMTAIKASERGAYEYLPKPFDLRELVAIVGRALAEPKRRREEPDTAAPVEVMPIVGRSPAMQDIFRVLARLMQTDLTVMISGESGTGKELVARALHDYGKRKGGPFVAINMAAIPRDLIESELFGHEKGAFTGAAARSVGRFEQAEGGTLFLDEIGDMPMEAQTRLLRVLQQGEYTTVGGRTPIKTERADRRRDQQGPALRHPAGRVPRGFVLPPQCRADPSSAVARALGGHPRPRARLLPARLGRGAADQDDRARGDGAPASLSLARQRARTRKSDPPPGRALSAGGDRRGVDRGRAQRRARRLCSRRRPRATMAGSASAPARLRSPGTASTPRWSAQSLISSARSAARALRSGSITGSCTISRRR